MKDFSFWKKNAAENHAIIALMALHNCIVILNFEKIILWLQGINNWSKSTERNFSSKFWPILSQNEEEEK